MHRGDPGARKRSLTGGLAGVDCTKQAKAKGKAKAKAKAKGKGKGNADEEERNGMEPAEPSPLPGVEPPPLVPLLLPPGPEHVAVPEPARVFGCTKCRNARAGCQQCRKPGYRARGPKRQPVDRDGVGS